MNKAQKEHLNILLTKLISASIMYGTNRQKYHKREIKTAAFNISGNDFDIALNDADNYINQLYNQRHKNLHLGLFYGSSCLSLTFGSVGFFYQDFYYCLIGAVVSLILIYWLQIYKENNGLMK